MTGHVSLSIAADHPAFAGHFPDMPIVPGVVLLDEALHAIGEAIGIDLSACTIGSLKFLSPVRPGEPVCIDYGMQAAGAIRFDILSGERKIATGTIRLSTHEDERN